MTYTNFNLEEKNPQAIITQNTSAQITSTSGNTYITINGSEITYTPVTGSSKVIYEIGFYVEALNKAAFQHIVLEQILEHGLQLITNLEEISAFQVLQDSLLEIICTIDL